jgi:hypothetical protein
MILDVARVARPCGRPQIGDLLSEPPVRGLAELQPRVGGFALAAARLDLGVVTRRARRGDRVERTTPALTAVGVAVSQIERTMR